MSEKKQLKLYVWDGVLCDYYCGIVFALAESPSQAKKLIVEKYPLHKENWRGLKFDGVSPTCHKAPVAYAISGGG